MSAYTRNRFDLEAKVENTEVHAKAAFVASALLGFGTGVIDRVATGNYNPAAAAIATAILSTPFLAWGSSVERVGRYVSVNAGLNAGYGSGYAATDAIIKLFSS